MKALAKFFSLLAATCFALNSLSKAQVETYETISSYAGSSQFSIPNNRSAGETFTDLIGIQSLTYNFFNNGSSAETQLSAVFAIWNGTGSSTGTGSNTSNYTTLVNFGNFVVPASTTTGVGGWNNFTNDNGTFSTFTYQFDFSALEASVGGIYPLDPNATYALLVKNTSGSTTSFGIGFVAEDDQASPFQLGTAGIGLGSTIQDYTFSQIVVEPAPPVPESSTVASILAALFVAGIVTYRIRQRRQQLAPVAVVAI